MRRPLALTAALLSTALLVSGCGSSGPTLRSTLIADVDRAQGEPHRYTLLLSTSGHHYAVDGLIEDDARYSARVAIDDREAWDEVASDDTLADRFADPSALPRFLRAAGTGAQAAVPNIRGELAASHWVIDDVGAPDLLSGNDSSTAAGHPREFGQDPVLDGVATLDYVRQVLSTQEFRPFNKNDLDYDPATDTFPKPVDGGPLRRFDSIRTDLPTAAQIQGFGGRATLPDVTNFRRMSIYVDAQNRVVRVLEKIDVANRLTELLSVAGIKLPQGLSTEQATAAVVDALNKQRVAQGDDPIDVHELDLTLVHAEGQHVHLPAAATKGSLALLIGRGSLAAAAS